MRKQYDGYRKWAVILRVNIRDDCQALIIIARLCVMGRKLKILLYVVGANFLNPGMVLKEILGRVIENHRVTQNNSCMALLIVKKKKKKKS